MILRSLGRGLAAATRRYRVGLVLYLVNLAAACALAAPMAVLIDDAFGRSLSGLDLASSFRFEAIVDFLRSRHDALANHFQVLGFGVLFYAAVSAVLTGGVIDSLKSPPRSPFLPRFMGGCGRYALRYLRLIVYLGIALVGLYWLNRGLDRLIVLAFDQTDHEVAAFWIMRGKQGLALTVLLVLAAVFDLARVLTAFEDRTHMIGALMTSLGFVGRHLGSILGLYTVLLTFSLTLFVTYLLVAHALLPPSSVVLLLAAQQIVMFMRHGVRVVGLASLMAHYRAATGAPPESGDLPMGGGAPGAATLTVVTLVVVAAGAARAAQPAARPVAPPAIARQPESVARTPLSPRVVSYQIEASLDPAGGSVTGRETIVYRNATRVAMKDLAFHLYPNAFSNTHSTFMRGIPWTDEQTLQRLERMARERSWGLMKVVSVRLADGSDLTARATIDDTVMTVPLPRPVPPGDSARIEVAWETLLPRTFDRMGRWGDHFDVMQWFPKPAVFTDAGWKIYPFYRTSEFFADFGTFEVTLKAPREYVVEATGVPGERHEGPDGTLSVTYRAEDVHDFAWIADRNAQVARTIFSEGPYASSPVEILYVHQPYRRRMAPRIIAAVEEGLRFYGARVMPYPYPRLVIDDLPMGLGGGMEYPMLFTTSMAWFLPQFYTAPQEVTLHEFGHQYWYGIVATNEFEEPWLDEGIDSYVTRRVMETIDPPRPGRTADGLHLYVGARLLAEGLEAPLGRFTLDLDQILGIRETPFRPIEGGLLGYPVSPFWLDLPGVGDGPFLSSKDGYAKVARDNPITTPAWGFRPGSYTGIVYDKTDVALETIGRLIGKETLDQALREYVRRFRFAHPGSDDFFAVLVETAGRARPGLDLRPFIQPLFYGTGRLDFAVASLKSREAKAPRGLVPPSRAGLEPLDRRGETPLDGSSKQYESEVIVARPGEIVLPVEILVKFEDGVEVRESWDGRDTWKRFTYEREARAASAEIDPGGIYAMDLDRTNNSLTLDRNQRAIAPLVLHWLFLVQNELHLASSLL